MIKKEISIIMVENGKKNSMKQPTIYQGIINF